MSIMACLVVLFVVSPINLGQKVAVSDSVCFDVGFVDLAERPVQVPTCVPYEQHTWYVPRFQC